MVCGMLLHGVSVGVPAAVSIQATVVFHGDLA